MGHQTIEQQYNILIESRLSRLETMQENMNENQKNIMNILSKLDSKVDSHFMWTIGLIMTLFGSIIVSGVLKALHLIL
jgi:hypothetical protein